MEMMMNNSQGSDPAYYYSVDPGHNSGCGNGGGVAEGFLDMFGDHHSSGDLFDLVWQGGPGASSGMELQPSHLPSSPPPAVVLPPSEDEMASWLYPIVQGDELVFTAGQDDHPGDFAGHVASVDDQHAAPVKEVADHKKAAGGARTKSHHAEAHNLTEKRRRCKISEKFKTLQQLVPGCDKSNQLSTLDQTIQYMKSLQQQIQAMSFGCGVNPTAVYTVAAPPYLPPAAAAAPAGFLVRGHVRPGVVLAPPPAMVPFGPLLPLVHHHQHPAAMASAPMLYPAAAAPNNICKGSSSRVRENNSTSRNKG